MDDIIGTPTATDRTATDCSTADCAPAESGNTAVRRGLTVAAAAAGALAVWAIAGPVAGASLDAGARHVGPAAVIVSAVLAGLAGWGLLAVMERRAKRPARTWAITAAVVLGVSLTGPRQADDAGSFAALSAMHLVVGVIVIVGLARTARRARR